MDNLDPSAAFGLFTAFSFVLGCCIGSFMNVVVWRLPRGESLLHPPSHCPKCGHAIRPWENIPILSWLFLKARCSSCHLPISIKYPLGEAATGLLFAVLWLRLYQRELPLDTLPALFYLTAALLAAALIDSEHRFIPDEITISGILFAILMAILLPAGRISLQPRPSPHHGSLFITGLCSILHGWHLPWVDSPRIQALLDCLLGTAMGYAILGLFAWATRPFFGRVSKTLHKPIPITLDASGIHFPKRHRNWDEMLDSKTDHLILHGTLPKSPTVVRIAANALDYSIDGTRSNWESTREIKAKVHRLTSTRDAIGQGDVKLLAMIGAFLGADATIYTLLVGALLGFLYAIVYMLAKRRVIPSIPFGPFLAIAAMLWPLCGNLAFRLLN